MQYLRIHHNNIKLQLLKKYSDPGNKLLDIGTGRGGDLLKWDKCKLSHVTAIDIEPSYIEEAILRKKNNNIKKDFRFIINKEINYSKFGKFNIITCNFCFHYLCSSLTNIKNVFYEISNSLLPDGKFILTIPDGYKIKEILNINSIYKNRAGVIEKNYSDYSDFGMAIKFMLTETLYFGDSSISNEYLVFSDIIEKVANNYKLELIESEPFHNYNSKVKHLMDGHTKFFSDLYLSLVFKKI